jgi:hypothetical protein
MIRVFARHRPTQCLCPGNDGPISTVHSTVPPPSAHAINPHTVSTKRPVSIPQNSHAVVTSKSAPTFHPTSLAITSQSHVLPHVNRSQKFKLSGAIPTGRTLGVTSPATLGTTLLVTHSWTVLDHPVVTPMTIHASNGRFAPRNHSVT